MTDEGDHALETIKAFKESAKLGQEAVGFLRDVYETADDLLRQPLKDLVGISGGNWLKAKQIENLAISMQKAKNRLKDRGIEEPEMPSPSFLLPWAHAASKESDEALQDLWERLLANACDPNRDEPRKMFVEVLEQLDPQDALFLSERIRRLAANPSAAVTSSSDFIAQLLREDIFARQSDAELSMQRLQKLGILREKDTRIKVTQLGNELMLACEE